MKKILFLYVSVLLCSTPLFAQHHYQWVLDSLQHCSVTLSLLRQRTVAQQAELAASPLIENPQVSFEHLWASRTGEGNRWNASVSQQLPMPGQYGAARRIRSLGTDTLEIFWLMQRQRVLLDAQRSCADIVYVNMQLAHYAHCITMAQQVVDAMSRRMELGDCSAVDYNRAHLELATLQNKAAVLRTLRNSKMSLLRTSNGDKELAVTDTVFPSIVLPDSFDQWYEQVRQRSPEMRMAETQGDLCRAQYDRVRWESLPSLSAGVVAEYEADCLFRGVAVGLSVPLWNRRRQVSGARLGWQAAQYEVRQVEMELSGRLHMLYDQVRSLSDEVTRLAEQCERYGSESMLLKAFLLGEIPLESYLRQVEFFHDTEMGVIDARYELECAWLDLMSITL